MYVCKTFNTFKIKNVSGGVSHFIFLPKSIDYLCYDHGKEYNEKFKEIGNKYENIKIITINELIKESYTIDDGERIMKLIYEYIALYNRTMNYDIVNYKLNINKFVDIYIN